MPDTPASADRRNDNRLVEACARAEAEYRARTPRSAAAYRKACAAMPGGNTRTVLHYDPYPVTINRADGARLTDLDGHVYVDFLGEYSAGLYGHSEPKIVDAIRAALEDGIVFGGPNRTEAELAQLFVERFPSVDLIRFTNSGTEANLMALGAARAHTGRDRVLVFDGAYHGGVIYMADYAARVNAPFDYVVGTYNDFDATMEAVSGDEEALAAILVEPMAGAGGAIPGDVDFLRELRALADRSGAALIFDEVMTSRIGPGGLQQELAITPDLTTFGKYLGGGLTFGAFGGRRDIMARFDPRRPDALPHAGTFNNNALSMAAGLVGLRDVFTPKVAAALRDRGNAFRARLDAVAQERGLAMRVTGMGSIMNVHFQTAAIRRPADTVHTPPAARTLFQLEMMARGFYLARRGYMALSLAMSDSDLAGFETAVATVLDRHGDLFGA